MLGLYLHIPFCQSICSYCNFSRGLFDAALKARYVDALEREILNAGDGQPADTIFFGGGTPSLLDAEDVARLIRACAAAYALDRDAEITLEANPETLTSALVERLLEAGVTRISVGVQTFDDDELTRLGRTHSAARAVAAIDAARAGGCVNLSLDLMLWLPGQSLASWRRTVARAIALGPDHLSLYLLELYPNAPLHEAMARAGTPLDGASPSDWTQATDDVAADMYLEGLASLDAAGFLQYEISNVAKPGCASRHNLKYWQSGAWRGHGAAAHSTVNGHRWRNVASPAEFIGRVLAGRSPAVDVECLHPAGRMQEALFTGLRLSQGIACGPFQARFGVDPWGRYGAALQPYVDEGYLWHTGGAFGLTRRGMLVANEILLTFM